MKPHDVKLPGRGLAACRRILSPDTATTRTPTQRSGIALPRINVTTRADSAILNALMKGRRDFSRYFARKPKSPSQGILARLLDPLMTRAAYRALGPLGMVGMVHKAGEAPATGFRIPDDVTLTYGDDDDLTSQYVSNASGGYYIAPDGTRVVPTGVPDIGAAINAIVADLPATGGTIYAPGAAYAQATMAILSKKVAILASGGKSETPGVSGTTHITKAAALTTAAFQITAAGCEIHGITLDGEAGNSGPGIEVLAGRALLTNLSVHRMGGDGIRIGHDSVAYNCNFWHIENVVVRQNGAHGIHIHDPGSTPDPDVNGGLLLGMDATANTGDGLRIGTAWANSFYGVLVQTNGGAGVRFTAGAVGNQMYGGEQNEANVGGDVVVESGANANLVDGVYTGTVSDSGTNTFLRVQATFRHGPLVVQTIGDYIEAKAPIVRQNETGKLNLWGGTKNKGARLMLAGSAASGDEGVALLSGALTNETGDGLPIGGQIVLRTVGGTFGTGIDRLSISKGSTTVNGTWTGVQHVGLKLGGNLDANNNKITGLAAPTAATDAATMGYVDTLVNNLDFKPSVRAASTGNLVLSGTQVVDGVSLNIGDRVMPKDQTIPAENGIYVVAAGAWARAADADTSAEVTNGMAVYVAEGTVNASTTWVLTTADPIVLDTTALTFTQMSGLGQVTAGAALTKTGNQLDVAVDGSSIEVSGDALQVKALGVTNAMLAGSIATSKLLDATTTPGASKIPIAYGSGKLAAGWGGAASTLATLDSGARLTPAEYPRLPVASSKTGAYTVVGGEGIIPCDASGGTFAVTLPTPAAGNAGEVLDIVKTDSSGNAVTVDINGGASFLGDGTTVTLASQGDNLTAYSTGSAWVIR